MAAQKAANHSVTAALLDQFDARTAGAHDPGQLIILFDHRHIGPENPSDDQFTRTQKYYLDGLIRLGWPTYWNNVECDPGNLLLTWYTHAGNQGSRTYPLHRAGVVKEMFDSLSAEGFRPMIMGWSGENPYPMIGGTEPPPAPAKPKVKVATSASGTFSGHGGGSAGTTPHERVMRIIEKEEEREAKERASIVELEKKADSLGYGV